MMSAAYREKSVWPDLLLFRAQPSRSLNNELLRGLSPRHLDESRGASAFIRNATATGGNFHPRYAGDASISLSSDPQLVEVKPVTYMRSCRSHRSITTSSTCCHKVISSRNRNASCLREHESCRSQVPPNSNQAICWMSPPLLFSRYPWLRLPPTAPPPPLPLRERCYCAQR